MEPHVLLVAIVIGLLHDKMVCLQKYHCNFENTWKPHDSLRNQMYSAHS